MRQNQVWDHLSNDTAVAAIRQYPGLITLAFFCTLLWLTRYEIEDTTGFCGTSVIELMWETPTSVDLLVLLQYNPNL